MTTTGRSALLLLAALLAGSAGAAPAAAQEGDPRWAPWIGCWQAVASEEEPQSDGLLCIRPTTGGVEVIEVMDGQPGAVQTLVADGDARDVAVDGCEGWRSVEFSLDGQRLFTRADQACAGDEHRPSTGVIAMVSPREWIDVQATTVQGEALSWVRRYRAARPDLAEAAGFGALAPARGASARAARAAMAPDVDDVLEAAQAIDAEAVRSWIAELNDPFDLDADRLVRLADAGVDESIIDVMVAVSYPERFALQRDGDIDELDQAGYARGPRYGRYGRPTVFIGAGAWDPFYYRPFGYGYGYGGYYGGYGYPYGGYYSPGVVIVVPRQEAESDARVVRGRGYTRGGSRDSNGGSAQPRSVPARRGDRPAAGGSSSRAPRQPSAPSSGGSSSGGRQAKPRGG